MSAHGGRWLNGQWQAGVRRSVRLPWEARKAKLNESNMAMVGSQLDRQVKKAAAATETEFKGAGKRVGILIWRVENRRTDADTPDFGIKRWPEAQYGSFYKGDSYIVLHTYKAKDPRTGKVQNRLLHNLFMWQGLETTQDEKGVCAAKAVELDTLLNDVPVQFRETQGRESGLFQALFKEIRYMEGGIDSGFRHVKPQEYEARLFLVRTSRRTTRSYQVPREAQWINHGDCFVLDAGLKVYRFIGEGSTPFEKNKSGLLQSNIVNSRNGKAVKAEVDDGFWDLLEGSEDDVRPKEDPLLPGGAQSGTEERLEKATLKLYRISDAAGNGVTFTHEASGSNMSYRVLDTRDVFLVHANVGIFIWMGRGATRDEKSQSYKLAEKYIEDSQLEKGTPITMVKEQNALHNHLFMALFKL